MPKRFYQVETLEANSSIGYLIRRCGVLMTLVAEQRFAATAMSFSHWVTLIWLSSQSSHLSATQLSADLGHDMGALTRIIDELERRGLVRRERSRRDRRAVEIAITPAGRRQARSAKRIIVELLNDLVEPYSNSEILGLIGLLQRMLQHLQQVAAVRLAAPAAAARGSGRRVRRRPDTGVTA